MFPKEKCFDLLSNSLNHFLKEMYEGQYGEFICGYWGLKTIVLEGLSKILSRA